jgi:hypothetical protein
VCGSRRSKEYFKISERTSFPASVSDAAAGLAFSMFSNESAHVVVTGSGRSENSDPQRLRSSAAWLQHRSKEPTACLLDIGGGLVKGRAVSQVGLEIRFEIIQPPLKVLPDLNGFVRFELYL